MATHLLAATSRGLFTFTRIGTEWTEAGHFLSGKQVTCLIARDDAILAGTTEGVFRCKTTERTGFRCEPASQGLTNHHIRWLAYHPDILNLNFAGTEPAGIFVSYDEGEAWRSCPEVAQLREANSWYLPYSPAAGCVRGFSFHGSRGYAAVEVGGVLRSDDSGETWRLAEGSSGKPEIDTSPPSKQIHPDVHSIVVHPASPELLFAPTGGGFYRSSDGGKTWDFLYDCYCRACWIDYKDSGHILLGVADGVDRNGRIEESSDGGITWEPADKELATPWKDHMVERFYQFKDELFAVLSNGELFSTKLEDWRWKKELPSLSQITSVTIIQE